MPFAGSPTAVRAIPPRAGVGLKAQHYRTIIDETPNVGFFEGPCRELHVCRRSAAPSIGSRRCGPCCNGADHAGSAPGDERRASLARANTRIG